MPRYAESVPGGGESADIQVNRDNVLYVRGALMDEYRRVTEVLESLRSSARNATPCANDPVSTDAAIAFPERIELLLKQCHQHNEDLQVLVDNLTATARQYGYTENQLVEATPEALRATLGSIGATAASQISNALRRP